MDWKMYALANNQNSHEATVSITDYKQYNALQTKQDMGYIACHFLCLFSVCKKGLCLTI